MTTHHQDVALPTPAAPAGPEHSGAGKVGSKLDYAACRGGPNEQWSINPNGTITTIQVGLCISQSGTGLELAKCTTAASEKWTYKPESAPS
jgi:hypothetical protein